MISYTVETEEETRTETQRRGILPRAHLSRASPLGHEKRLGTSKKLYYIKNGRKKHDNGSRPQRCLEERINNLLLQS